MSLSNLWLLLSFALLAASIFVSCSTGYTLLVFAYGFLAIATKK
jgi:hypothetical protein